MKTDKKYKEVNGTFYDERTSGKIIEVLENAGQNNTRIMLEYGDVETGKGWGDTYDVTGYIGRSMGPIKIPILVHNARSSGGGGILDHCIVNIVTAKGKANLYSHPSYMTGRK